MVTGQNRTFLFLQGPHGPYFRSLARMLKAAGSTCWRVGFNAGDAAFWTDKAHYIPFQDPIETWANRFHQIVTEKSVTDIVLYGDTRRIHAEAVEIARALGLTIHVFEEGYLRPFWVTYERNGSNGNSALMDLSVQSMKQTLSNAELEIPEAPAHWGDMRQHVFYGALYHGHVLLANRAYSTFAPHRALTVAQEFKLYLRRLILMPFLWADRVIATTRIKHGGFPYHLALLQLEHDSSFQKHSPYESMPDFLEHVIRGFAEGAPLHHHFVFKAHPLEDGRVDLRKEIKRIAAEHNVSDRVHYVRGGKLAQLLDHARSAVTVNSTAAQQALWRGLPLKVFGDAVYAKPEFVSTQPLRVFFNRPARPDSRAYRDYRHFLLETSQIAGGFYSARGRRQLLRQVVDMMLAPEDPYEALRVGTAAPRQQLRAII